MVKKSKLTINRAQSRCRQLRARGDKISLAKASYLEAKFKKHPDYESDLAWLLRKQAG